jgi:hypothetical protein
VWEVQLGSWEVGFGKLVAYKEQHGNTDVPKAYKDKSLATWVKDQRYRQKCPVKRNRLTVLGFKWGERRGKTATRGTERRGITGPKKRKRANVESVVAVVDAVAVDAVVRPESAAQAVAVADVEAVAQTIPLGKLNRDQVNKFVMNAFLASEGEPMVAQELSDKLAQQHMNGMALARCTAQTFIKNGMLDFRANDLVG